MSVIVIMTHNILVRKWHTLLFPVKNVLTTATKIWTSHVNSGKGLANVVTFVVVPILCNNVIEIICPYYYRDIAFRINAQAIASFPSQAWERGYTQA